MAAGFHDVLSLTVHWWAAGPRIKPDPYQPGRAIAQESIRRNRSGAQMGSGTDIRRGRMSSTDIRRGRVQ